jgi:hypothetical protein
VGTEKPAIENIAGFFFEQKTDKTEAIFRLNRSSTLHSFRLAQFLEAIQKGVGVGLLLRLIGKGHLPPIMSSWHVWSEYAGRQSISGCEPQKVCGR